MPTETPQTPAGRPPDRDRVLRETAASVGSQASLTRFIDVQGIPTRILTAGVAGAPALVLVHGLSLTSEIWVRNIDPLARDFAVIAVDLLGHGFTRPRGGEPVGFADKIHHLEAVIDTLGLQRFSISGSSYGGLVAANLALRRRDRLDRLIINGSGSVFNTEPQLLEFVGRIQASYRPGLGESSGDAWRARLRNTVLDASSIPDELIFALPLCYAQPWAVPCWEATVREMLAIDDFRRFRILDRLESFDVPTLVVWGRDDKGGIFESAVAAVKRMPRAEIVAFERCGHLPMLEQPAKYNALVREYLATPRTC